MARSKSLTELGDVELLGMLDEAKDEATNLRFQHVTGQLDNMNLLARSRRQVARILTELRAREIDTAEAVMARRSVAAAESPGAGELPEAEPGEVPAEGARVFKRRRRRHG
ncbi:MAG: 50S ribosomal protein L29 [Acidimicrobiia bacterium]|nr:50S ribosomal protein L29 [Acidimicrobiia bacterium]MYB24836.1 50S ribosomal protein L29 [Acidimicrobiia bacterium]MYE67836.1 50S ribosomal protein L29 [Acidimicrobiia bacterium]MYJ13063.1 50S ribosomal protein L29 [Acidimicrobiia bacterium]